MSQSAVGYAIAAAICFAVGTALQHQAATSEQSYRSGIHLLWRLARNRRWATGMALAGAGVVLHAAALHVGALVVVQPVLVTGLALALPVRALLDRARPSAAQAAAAAVLAAGVAVFVVAAHPTSGHSEPDGRGAAAVIAAGVLLAVLCSVVAARASSGPVAGFALALAAGTLYGLTGGVLKATVDAAVPNPVAAVADWPVWTLAALGVWALILHQRAYTHAPLSLSLPVLSVANPLAGTVFGIMVFGETPASTPLALLGMTLGLTVIVAGVAVLARLPAPADSPAARPGGGLPPVQPGGQPDNCGKPRSVT